MSRMIYAVLLVLVLSVSRAEPSGLEGAPAADVPDHRLAEVLVADLQQYIVRFLQDGLYWDGTSHVGLFPGQPVRGEIAWSGGWSSPQEIFVRLALDERNSPYWEGSEGYLVFGFRGSSPGERVAYHDRVNAHLAFTGLYGECHFQGGQSIDPPTWNAECRRVKRQFDSVASVQDIEFKLPSEYVPRFAPDGPEKAERIKRATELIADEIVRLGWQRSYPGGKVSVLLRDFAMEEDSLLALYEHAEGLGMVLRGIHVESPSGKVVFACQAVVFEITPYGLGCVRARSLDPVFLERFKQHAISLVVDVGTTQTPKNSSSREK